MKVALISEYNHLTTIGGTEHYTEILAQKLCIYGIELIFISKGFHKDEIIETIINYNSCQYKLLLLPSKNFNSSEIKLKSVSYTWDPIFKILNDFKPDIINIHTFSTFFNIRHIEQTALFFKNLVFTSHIPEHFCPKGDMIFKNKRPCDGKIGMKCNFCLLSTNLRDGLKYVFKGYINDKKRTLDKLNTLGVHIVSTSEWQKKQLVENGMPNAKINIIRQALKVSSLATSSKNTRSSSKIIIGFLGRLSPEKGSALLLELLENLKNNKLFHFVLGVPANSDSNEIEKLYRIVNNNPNGNIEIIRTVNFKTKANFFSSIDVLFIPSFCIETGPFVLLESIFYGKRVLAPDVGGPLEFQKEYPDSVLLYKWNNKEDVLKSFNHLSDFLRIKIVVDDKKNQQKEDAFLNQHLELFNQLLSNQKI
jgi:glycosyltransferase involved in cell wall biosynthesis